jgi:type VI secretion system secreted protein Hcp
MGKRTKRLRAVLVTGVLVLLVYALAGDPSPPGAPAPTMASLDQVHALASGGGGSVDAFGQGLTGARSSSGGVYLKVDGIPGESTNDGYRDWIECLGLDYEIHQPVSTGFVPSKKAERSVMTVLKEIDSTTPVVSLRANDGSEIKEVIIAQTTKIGREVEYLRIVLEGVYIASVRPVLVPRATGFAHLEEIGLMFSRITWEYYVYEAGRRVGTYRAGWDFVANRER